MDWTEMIGEDIKQLKTGKRELRHFGLLVGAVLAGLGLLWLVRGRAHALPLLLPGVALLTAGLFFPKALKPLYIGWMTLAIVLGFIVSHVILTVFFFLVITPIGWVSRLCKKDFLRLKLDRQAPTYWVPRPNRRPKAPREYEQQF
ncbi:MAG TPA: SxtJ family membrane protein [Bacillota bacterium]|nr:SxtJ family membrane protein [Bacillota bacterium]